MSTRMMFLLMTAVLFDSSFAAGLKRKGKSTLMIFGTDLEPCMAILSYFRVEYSLVGLRWVKIAGLSLSED